MGFINHLITGGPHIVPVFAGFELEHAGAPFHLLLAAALPRGCTISVVDWSMTLPAGV